MSRSASRASGSALARRAAGATAGTVSLLLLASVLVFALVRSAPGDPIDIRFGETGAATYMTPDEEAAVTAELRSQLALDQPLAAQYVRWLGRVVRGDLGVSIRTGRPVTEEIGERLPATLLLGTAGFVIALVIGVGTAVLAARRPDGPVDHALRGVTLALASMPSFLSGSLALALAADHLAFPITGPASAQRLWVPAAVLGLSGAPSLARVLRASLIVERSRLYAHAARARGASGSRILLRHTMRPALSPVLSLAGLALAALVGGAVITEAIFSWPGIASYAIDAIRARDYPVVQGYVVVITVVVIVVNRSVDLLQRLTDPRTDGLEVVA